MKNRERCVIVYIKLDLHMLELHFLRCIHNTSLGSYFANYYEIK